MKIGPHGKVLEFAGNSKCASGTGSFLKAACEVLQIDLDRLDELSGRAEDIAKVSTTCAVFAESAIISNVHYGYSLESICAGVCDSVASRLMDALNRVGIEEELFFLRGRGTKPYHQGYARTPYGSSRSCPIGSPVDGRFGSGPFSSLNHDFRSSIQMMYAGVDVGSRTAKVVILNENKTIGTHLISTGPDSAETSISALEGALVQAGISMDELSGIVTTGYGRYIAPFPHTSITEIACHSKGVHLVFPTARTVLDMGGQDCKAIRLDAKGNHTNFVMNDKCAAGTGRFLEILALSMNIPLEEIGLRSLQAKGTVKISSMCAVFAREEALRHRRRGAPLEDILAGVHESVAERGVQTG